jgi:hypothetical protein
MVVVFCHISEGLHLFAWLNWGQRATSLGCRRRRRTSVTGSQCGCRSRHPGAQASPRDAAAKGSRTAGFNGPAPARAVTHAVAPGSMPVH